MPNYITTYSREHFYPTEPEASKIHIEDIAHALSLICRGNGHVTTFWSVGEHCINCAREAMARGYSREVSLACLLHDASECFMSDVPRPFKKELPKYSEWEDKLIDTIFIKFIGRSLTEAEQKLVKEVDDAMLWFDVRYLLDEQISDKKPEVSIPISYEVRAFKDVEDEYLELYNTLR